MLTFSPCNGSLFRLCEQLCGQRFSPVQDCLLGSDPHIQQHHATLLFNNTILSDNLQWAEDTAPSRVSDEFSCSHTLISAICLQKDTKLTAYTVFGEVDVYDSFCVLDTGCFISHCSAPKTHAQFCPRRQDHYQSFPGTSQMGTLPWCCHHSA